MVSRFVMVVVAPAAVGTAGVAIEAATGTCIKIVYN